VPNFAEWVTRTRSSSGIVTMAALDPNGTLDQCHIPEHEDKQMTRPYAVGPPQNPITR